MSNPAPRPALRKAGDAEIHPAAPRPARSPRAARTPAPPVETPAAPTTSPSSERQGAAAAQAAATATSSSSAVHKAKARKSEAPRKRKFSGSTSDTMRVPDVSAEIAEMALAARERAEKHAHRPLHDTFFGEVPAPETDAVLAAVPAHAPASAKPGKAAKAAKAPGHGDPWAAPKAAAPARSPKPAKAPNLMSGKAVELEVEVPKELRKAAKAEARSRGLDLDTVVIDLLLDWLSTGA